MVRKKRPEGKTRRFLSCRNRGSHARLSAGKKPQTVNSFLSLHNRRKDLFNALAAALDKDDQHNYRKDGGNDANKCYIVHVNSPFLLNKILVKTLHYGDGRRPQRDQEQGRKNEKYKREDKFDRCLCCLLLHFLTTLGSEGVGMDS